VGHKFIYVFLALSCVFIQKYLPVAGLDLGLGLQDLTSALASTFWPRLTSLDLSPCENCITVSADSKGLNMKQQSLTT